jgi:hypothetical protein
MRMNGIKKEEVDEFVASVSDKGLSLRDIEVLANGYFKGGQDIREQIKSGNIAWGLSRLKHSSVEPTDCTQIERRMLTDLEITQKYMQRVINKSQDDRFKNASFFAQAHLISGGILRQLEIFSKAVEVFHDQCGQTPSDLSAS